MKSVVICSNSILNYNLEYSSRFFLGNMAVSIGIVNQEYSDSEILNLDPEYVLVEKIAFSCNYRDKALIYYITNTMNINSNGAEAFYSPIGSEFVGTVLKCGKNVKTLNEGDRIIPTGQFPFSRHSKIAPGLPTNFASKRYQVFHEAQLYKLPGDIPDEVASSMTIAGHTVFSMIEKANIKSDDRILITSAKSNTALSIAAALKGKGYEVWGYTTSDVLSESYKSRGFEELIINSSQVSDLMLVDKIRHLVEVSGGFDVVFDPFSDLHIGKVTSCMKANSRYLTCGSFDQLKSKRNNNFVYSGKNVPDLLTDIIVKNISIIGNCLGHMKHLDYAVKSYLNGSFDIPIDCIVEDNDIAYFFDRTFNDPKRLGKVVYRYTD